MATTRRYGPGLQLNNKGFIIMRDWVADGNEPGDRLRQWHVSRPDQPINLATGGNCGVLISDYLAIFWLA